MRSSVPNTPAIGDLVAWLADLEARAALEAIEVDLGNAEPAPVICAPIAAFVAARRARGLGVTLCGGRAAQVAALQPIVDLRTARSQADAAAERFEREAPTAAPSVVRAVRFVFEELGANVVQHSRASETGFGAVAPAPGGFELALADRGIGFRASLERHPDLAGRIQDDAEAIQLAVEKGLSGVGGRTNMGMGLGMLCDLSDRLRGEVWIVSGDALWHRRTGAHALRVATTRRVPPYPGALVCLRAPLTPVSGPGVWPGLPA